MSCDCINTVTSIADEIISDLDNDSSLSTSYVATWVRNNVGKVNNLIGTSFDLDENLEYTPCVDQNIKDIIKWLFICQYYKNAAKSNLGASAYDWSEVREGDSVVRRVSKNEIAKTFLQLSSQCSEDLKDLIKYYKVNSCLPASMSSATTNMFLYNRVDDPQ
jgi:hypothetical protein